MATPVRRHRMDNDDQPIGRVLTRREALKLFGLMSAATASLVVAGCAPGQSATNTPLPATSLPLPTTAPTSAPTTVPASAATSTAIPASATPQGAVVVPACIVRPELTEGPY